MAEVAMNDKKLVTRVLQTIAMRKVASSADVGACPPCLAHQTNQIKANAIAYLASDKAAGHVCGTIVEVTGTSVSTSANVIGSPTYRWYGRSLVVGKRSSKCLGDCA